MYLNYFIAVIFNFKSSKSLLLSRFLVICLSVYGFFLVHIKDKVLLDILYKTFSTEYVTDHFDYVSLYMVNVI